MGDENSNNTDTVMDISAVDVYDFYQVDLDLIEGGTWVTLDNGSEMKLRSFNSKIAQAAYEKARAPYIGMIRALSQRKKPIPDEIDRKITSETLARGVIVDWRKMPTKAGQLKHSVDAALKLLTDLPYLSSQVAALSLNIANFQRQDEEDDAKNSSAG